MTLEEILTNTEAYPDTLELTVADGVKLPLSQIRHAVLAERKMKAEIAAQQAELARASEEVVKLYQQAMAAQAAPAATGPSAQDTAVAADEYLAPVLKRLEKLEGGYTELSEKKITQLAQAMKQAVEQYMYDRYEQQFESLPERPQDLTLESLIAKAAQDKYVDRFNRPDIRRAYNEIHGPKLQERRIKEEAEKAYQRGKDEALAEARRNQALGRAPRGVAGKAAEKRPASLAEAAEFARADTSLAAQLTEGLSQLRRDVQ